MKVLIACEESQEICKAFRAKGHEAFSCDIKPCSGGHPEWHIQGDALYVIDHPEEYGSPGNWDLLIAHPPCTYLCNSGVRWLFDYKGKSLPQHEVLRITGYAGDDWRRVNISRFLEMRKAAEFFAKIYISDVEKIAVENPIMHKYAKDAIAKAILKYAGLRTIQPERRYILNTFLTTKPQITQPWMFGHGEVKATCLWLKSLPNLKPTDIVAGREPRVHFMSPGPERSAARAKTLSGIAAAMATQWG